MKIPFPLLPIIVCLLTTGCATMNSDFSCKVTAGDSCLTIEQVDAMTRFADSTEYESRASKTIHKTRHIEKSIQPYLAEKDHEEPIWVASWKDQSGHLHQASKLYAGRLEKHLQG